MNTVLGKMIKEISTLEDISYEQTVQPNSYVKGMANTIVNLKSAGIKEITWHDYDGRGSYGYSNALRAEHEKPFIAINPVTKNWKQTLLHEIGHLVNKDITEEYVDKERFLGMLGLIPEDYYPQTEVIADVFAFSLKDKLFMPLEEFIVTRHNWRYLISQKDDKFLPPHHVNTIVDRANEFAEKYILTK